MVMASPSDLGIVSSGIVCIDGPAGAGKTTLAGGIAVASGATVVHTDALLDGWDGLPRLAETVTPLVADLAAGRTGSYRRFDWLAGAFADTVEVEPAPLLVVEGVGCWNPALAGLVDQLVWVEAPTRLRRRRALARGDFGDHWDAWTAAEERLFARLRTRERADLVLETR